MLSDASEPACHEPEPEILISVCVAARNDNYCGNFRYRFATTLNHLAENARKAGVLNRIEILVGDWNSEERLGHALELSDKAKKITRFIYVPPAVAKAYNPPGRNFNTALSINVPIRRAIGKYIMCIASDILFSEISFQNLIAITEKRISIPVDLDKSLLGMTRKFVPWQITEAEPGIEELNRYLLFNSWMVPQEPDFWSGVFGGMGSILMHRDIYHECRGLDENLASWGWTDIDLGFRVNQRYPSLILSHLGVYCYEMNVRREVRESTWEGGNPRVMNRLFAPNDEKWGLAGLDLEIYLPDGPSPSTGGGQADENSSKLTILRDMRDFEPNPKIFEIFGSGISEGPDWPSIFLLSYVSARYKLWNFLDLSFMKGVAFRVVLLLCPWISCVGMGGLYRLPGGESLMDYFCQVRDRLAYRGQLRLINGDVARSLQSYFQQEHTDNTHDLVYLDSETVGEINPDLLDLIVSNLSAKGILVGKTAGPESLRPVVSHLDSKYKASKLIKSYKHGVFLFLHAAESSRRQPDSLEAATEEIYLNSMLTRSA
ncbi:MAG: hypothetical protein AB9866_25880 [Syntrophobacteraceae bacterium]